MVSYKDYLANAISLAKEKDYEQTRAEWLLLDTFNWSRTDYLIHMNDEMSVADKAKLGLNLQRMLSGEPIQYIVGFQSFYGYRFTVSDRCLIPRPETEEVMLHFLNLCNEGDAIADIGTGSGVLGITLKKLKPTLSVIATDLYEDALEVARLNAEQHGENIDFIQGNALKPLIERNIKVNGLISNPPYIDVKEVKDMAKTVVDYEPHQALFAKSQGYAIYQSILNDLPKVLLPGAHVVFEIGYNQGQTLKEIVNDMYPDKAVAIYKDINQLDRILEIKW
ncbi:peptide chain release factor N(5)-glutamine methyltransferase [Staphylococcus warneri]|uniref:Release factor glutamine methyltransferase n=1 Tax=Staphylococcus warneri TaxID=1292 RepID=A0A2T4Q1Y7_STAWA|nr:peptide chain release factor N(5)-glutamine methyltransferase [Staphylococcus warneri]PTI14243.1 peptide chain release factor N(5)-glutamine methyltransferase [Staphylococcus warneri]PTI16983.1 peptide chain release factor N(5)-glutamine methyltransferase [Staphylococcus warneri]PTI24669.1 peptide chain release factor N(5)-glutamine methyltransferase [Staphylococcus warneri]PTI34688.1 peptide chain release factor N(5)-glutamine methyltransferase [Staphylococcus warneri]PTI51802.1 peptide ch